MNDLVRPTGLREATPLASSHTDARPVQMTGAAARMWRRRRLLVAGLVGTGTLALVGGAGAILAADGLSFVDLAFLLAFAICAPWTVLGLVNAAIGFAIARLSPDPIAAVAPFATAGDTDAPIVAATAVVMTLRNEDPARALARLAIVRESLEETGAGDAFAYFVLSDTSDPAIAAQEEAAIADWRAQAGAGAERIHYRRRARNTGYKAGNIRDFVERQGRDFELMLTLDADSLMSADAILRMVRIVQASPRIGILQSLVVGAPSRSAFARIFQFGMRHGMRPYTLGSAWWTGECGPYWGHNAIVRIAPFRRHCRLPTLRGAPPLGGPVLSHDQVEAVLMRRAGWEVRVLPREGGSWEENPPTLLDFSKRDLRWCQGNLQYLKLLGLAGLVPTSRVQLVTAIAMFAAVPAMTLVLALAPVIAATTDPAAFPVAAAIALYLAFLALSTAPRVIGFLDLALTKGGVAAYGGAGRFAAGAAIELVFSAILGAVASMRLTLFMLGLALGRGTGWTGQARDAHRVSWGEAMRFGWPATAFGFGILAFVAATIPAALPVALLFCAGYLLAVPFAVITADPRLGAFFSRAGLCAIPEEREMPRALAALAVREGSTR